MKDYTQVERDNAALTIREYAFGQMNMLRTLGDEDAANNLQEAINMATAALRGSQPDPDTGCPECSWIDPALSDRNYCKNCGRRLREVRVEGTEGANE